MTTRIEIRHVSGSKANQIEQFQLDNLSELTIGRDLRSTIAFDPTRDDRVSRNHAVIRIIKGDQLAFRITDLGSSNGTRVNGNRIDRETDLLPDDRIELGAGGPVIVFDVQPRPPHLIARTRIIAGDPVVQPMMTRIDPVVPMATVREGSMAPTETGASIPTKVGVGRETVQRMLGAERQATSQKWMYTLAGILVLFAAIGGGLWYKTTEDKRQAMERVAAADAAAKAADAAAKAAREQVAQVEQKNTQFEQEQKVRDQQIVAAAGVSPSEIIRKFGSATVIIYVQWRVYDKETSKPLFHKAFVDRKTGAKLPAYVKVGNKIVRWLTTEDQERTNFAVGSASQGTGFVVSDQGYILTNKHVAAGWMLNFNKFSLYEEGKGLLFDVQKQVQNARQTPSQFALAPESGLYQDLFKWEPDQGGMIFRSDQPVPIEDSPRLFTGRNELLEVRFPESNNSIKAELVRESAEADVALIKINSPQTLVPVQLAKDDNVTIGGPITVLGYPASSAETFALIKTAEAGDVQNHVEKIPEPTVTPGNISRLSRTLEQQGAMTVLGSMGEVYQLTASASAGNSGGPVFDANGKVIALFTYGSARENTTWAVPIHYGRALFEVQQQ